MNKHLEMIKIIVEKIENNIAEELSVLSLAASLQISPWHFQRLFKGLIGDSLGSYMRGRRLSLAAEMLLSTDLRIIDIAFNVGFKSHEAFARAFKLHFDHSPKKFKEERPTILINKKPILTEILLEHAMKGIEQNPVIEKRNAQKIVGLQTHISSPFISQVNLCEAVSGVWISLWQQQNTIKERTPEVYYGLTQSHSGNFTEESLDYLAGVPVPEKFKTPEGMVSFTLPAQEVAVFTILSSIEEDSLQRTIDYIYGYWLPNSKYERGEGDDYGYFEGVIDFENPDRLRQKYVIPIKLVTDTL